ncbi:MAG: GIY-YIG nuclease family protein, partial [bacterium]|nr:GIY-YIG nuclease family protein [bacterium]
MFKKLSRYKAFTDLGEGFRYLQTHLTAMHYFYVLYSLKDNRLYKGSTSNLLRRVEQHNAGATRSTKHRRPFILLYFEEYADQLTALS